MLNWPDRNNGGMKMGTTEKDLASSFDQVAELYNKARPSYPAQLVSDLLSLAELPECGSILEIGCGPGKATVLFAPRGHRIVCLEPGESLAAVAERNLSAFPNVQIVRSRFEDWAGPENSFDLLISAQAFHWIEPKAGFAKASRVLKSTGAIGLFWNRSDEAGALYRQAFDEAYATYAPEIAKAQAEDVLEVWIEQWKQRIDSSGCFGTVLVKRYPWSLVYDAAAYLEMISTHSDHIVLPEQQKLPLFQAIEREIERLGGRITKKYVAVLFFGKRR